MGYYDKHNTYCPNAEPVNLVTTFSGEDTVNDVLKTETRGAYASINTATTTVIKSGAGHLNEIRIAGGTLGAVTVYDNVAASGTVIVPTVTVIAGQLLIANIDFSLGLTIVTAAATVITVSYR